MGFNAAMALLDKDTGSHFDPGVMAVFKPMAKDIFNRLAQADENATRQLLQDRVRRHFEL
jgi:hypothetical protein